jgi:ribonuclease T1
VRLAGACLLLAVFPVFAVQTDIRAQNLPPEARQTLTVIKSNGPFPYAQDGHTFGNREKLLPQRARGYYREYTVKTPGARDRGARRIVVGGGGEYFYTDDHYRSFRRIVDP